MNLLVTTLWNDIAHLPLLTPVEHHKDMSLDKTAGRLHRIFRPAGKAKPENIHRRRGLDRLKSSEFAHPREAAICRNRQHCPHRVPAVLSAIMYAVYVPILLHQLLHSRTHHQAKARVAFRLGSNELEKTRLGDHSDIWVAGFQTPEIGERNRSPGRLYWQRIDFGMIELEQAVGESQFLHNLHNRRMNSIATKIAVEVHMFFEQHHRDTLACKQQRKHSSRRASTHNTTRCLLLHRSISSRTYQAICLRMVRALNITISSAKINRADNCPPIPIKSSPLSITPRSASLA